MEKIKAIRLHQCWNIKRVFYRQKIKQENKMLFSDNESLKKYLKQDNWKIIKQNEHELYACRGKVYNVTEIAMLIILLILGVFCFFVYQLEEGSWQNITLQKMWQEQGRNIIMTKTVNPGE